MSVPLTLIHQGKTRDAFSTSFQDELLIVATNRLSTHNVVHKSEVPHKGKVLTALTIFWLTDILKKAGIQNHLVAYGADIYNHIGGHCYYPEDLHHRAIVVRRLSMIPVEFIYRGYLVGSLYKNYYKKNFANPYGIALESGLSMMSVFPEPIFTPTDKSETDEPLIASETLSRYPGAFSLSFHAFVLIRDHLRSLGLELVDSKFELGTDHDGKVVLADEVATPDSSRFCELSEIKLGVEPPWSDKQVARDEAERIWVGGEQYPLEFNSEIIHKLSETYLRIFHRITGLELGAFQHKRLNF